MAENPFLIFAVSKLPACTIKCSLVPVGTNIRDKGLLNCAGNINKNPYLMRSYSLLNLCSKCVDEGHAGSVCFKGDAVARWTSSAMSC